MRLSNLQQAVLTTLAYTDQFDFPLSGREVWQRLTVANSETAKPLVVTEPEIMTALRSLKRLKKVFVSQRWWSLRAGTEMASTRQTRAKISQAKWREAKSVAQVLAKLPGVMAIFVTGSLAMDNTKPHDDIDFMIVTKPYQLWITRLLVLLWASFKGKRRSWQGEEADSWCFNLWLSTNQLEVFKTRHSLYTAYEVIQAQAVYDRGEVAAQLLHSNSWIQKYLPNAKLGASPAYDLGEAHQSLSNQVWQAVDWLAFQFQYWYMKRHITRELVSREVAFFHPRDTQRQVTQRLHQTLNHSLHAGTTR